MIDVRGKNVSRFLNLCARKGIPVLQVVCLDSMHVTCQIYLHDFYELRPLVRKTRVRLLIKKRSGLPFLLHRYRKRKIFGAAVITMAVFICFLSTRIWRIEVVGNSSLSEETILTYLKSRQISYGVSRSSIDNDALELALRQDFTPVIWASVYEEGTKLVVCIQEKIASEPAKTASVEGSCVDLVAKEDAVIASVITRGGLAKVKAGDQVKKGDILVCGRQEILDDSGEVKEYFYQNADADVLGYVTLDYEDWIPEQTIVAQDTGNERTRYFLRLFEYQFTTPKLYADYDNYEVLEETHQLCLMNSFYLPVYVGSIRQAEQQKSVKTIDKAAAKQMALQDLEQFLSDLEENGVSIIDKNVMIEKINKKYHIYGKIKVCQNIAEYAPTEILTAPEPKTDEDGE